MFYRFRWEACNNDSDNERNTQNMNDNDNDNDNMYCTSQRSLTFIHEQKKLKITLKSISCDGFYT